MKLRYAAAFSAALFSAVVPISALGGSVAAAATTTTEVIKASTFAAPGNVWGSPTGGDTGTATLEEGPGTPLLGIGGLEMTVAGASEHRSFFNYGYGACTTFPACYPPPGPYVDLSTIDALSYSTYRDGSSTAPGVVPSFNIEIDPDGTSILGPGYTTLVWEPAYNGGGIVDDMWQTWDVLNGGAGVFWSSYAIPGVCATSCYVSWSSILAANPNAEILGGIGPNIGSGWSGFNGSVDALTIGVSGDTTIYDFEPQCSTLCYVDTVTGDDGNSGGQPTDAFKTIDKGIDSVTPGGTVQVAAGTYDENVRIDKQLTLQGAGQGVTTIVPATSNPNPCAGSSLCGTATAASNVILVESDDVTIADLTVDGDNTSLTSGVVAGGADLDARNGIIGNYYAGTFNNLEVHDVTVQNIYLRGVYASTSGTFDIHDNTVTNVQADPSSIAMMNWQGSGSFTGNVVSSSNDGIVSNHSSGTTYTGNVVTGSPSGIHTDNAGDAGGTPDVIQGNTVSGCPSGGYGIWVFVPYLAPTVDENTVAGCDIGLGAFGGAFSPSPTVTGVFTENTVSNAGAPAGSIGLWIDTTTFNWGDTDVDVSASNNFISGFETGVQVIESGGATATASLNDNSITGNTTGVPAITTAATLDAEGNWWGAASGPTNPSNPPGTGQSVGSGVDFTPWLCSGTDTSGAPGFQPTVAPCAGTVSFGADQVTVETHSGTHTVSVPVTLSPAYPGGTVTATWKTTDATAKAANNDYLAVTSGSVSFAPGSTSATISVTVKGDVKLEQYETFTVDLVSATNATIGGDLQAAITIKNDELPTVKVTGSSVNEGSPVKFTLKLNQQYYAPLTLSFSTLNTGTATSLAGDFTAVSGLPVTIPADLTTGLAWVTTLIDGVPEGVAETLKGTATGGKAAAFGAGKIKANVT